MPQDTTASHIEAISALDDTTRRRLYDHVAAQAGPVTRDEASDALGLDRSVAAYHLDKLVEQGLLAATFARPAGRTGPGAGRPAKRYERTDMEFLVALPPRDYRLAAELLARAAESDPSGAVQDALEDAAADYGRELAEESTPASADGVGGLADLLRRHGFEPYDDHTTLRLRNCPFHRLAQHHTELVCAMNLAMLGATAAATSSTLTAVLDPAPGRCCVAFVSNQKGAHDEH